MVRIFAVSGRGSGKIQALREVANVNTRLHQEDGINDIGHRLISNALYGKAYLEYDREEVLAENEKTFRKFINQKNRKKNKR